MNDYKSIIAKIKEIKPYLVNTYHISEIGIFGSYIKNKQTTKSDLDILISFNEKPSLFEYVDIENYLTDNLGVKVDLVMKTALKSNIGKSILQDVIYL